MKKIDKLHPMYQRGKWDAIKFAYVPDFKNEDEKLFWISGFTNQKEKQEGINATPRIKKYGL